MSDKEEKSKISFEDAYKKLEEISKKMQSNEVTLDETVTLYKEGKRLIEICEKFLKEAKVELDKLN